MAVPSWREAAARQAGTLAYFPLWGYATPPAIELADRIAGYAPGDLNRVFFTSGGGEAVDSAWKLAKQYFKLTGKPGKYKVDFTCDRLSRHPAGRAGDHRPAGVQNTVRTAHPRRLPGTEHQFLPRPGVVALRRQGFRAMGRRPDRRGDRIRRTRHRRSGVPRAGAERGRLHPTAAGLLRAGAGDLRPLRRAVGVRRGDLCLGPNRLDVRLHRFRLPARHHHLRQGPDVGVLADRRNDRERPAVRAVQRRHDGVSARLHLRRPPGVGSRRAGQPRHLRARGPQRSVNGRRRHCGPPWSGSTTCRSSAMSAARATSTRSNWSRTRRPGKPSPARRPQNCCRTSPSSLFDGRALHPHR